MQLSEKGAHFKVKFHVRALRWEDELHISFFFSIESGSKPDSDKRLNVC